jgi:hypothetical protein
MLLVAGTGFAAIALFHGGCCAGDACNTHIRSKDKTEKEIEYEKLL